jgi:hypothetical protein
MFLAPNVRWGRGKTLELIHIWFVVDVAHSLISPSWQLPSDITDQRYHHLPCDITLR